MSKNKPNSQPKESRIVTDNWEKKTAAPYNKPPSQPSSNSQKPASTPNNADKGEK